MIPWVLVAVAGILGLVPIDGRLAWLCLLIAGIIGAVGLR